MKRRFILKQISASIAINLTFSLAAAAFSAAGHEAIEKRAYAILGEWYRKDSILNPKPELLARYFYGASAVGAPGPPSPRTTYSDLSFDRQFAQELQPFHFMASNEAVLRAARLPGATAAARQHELLRQALPKCLALMHLLYEEEVQACSGGGGSGRGIFVLLHIIADSYSSEHATRVPDTWELEAIKGWELLRPLWPAAATAAEPGAANGQLTMLHRVLHAEGDKIEWQGRNDAPLSPRAEQAAQASAQMLKLVYLARSTNTLPAVLDAQWCEFVAKYFRPLNGRVECNATQHSYELLDLDADSLTLNKLPYDIFYFDYHTNFTFMAVGQLGRPGSYTEGAWGAEVSYHQAATAADTKRTLWNQLEKGITVGATNVLVPAATSDGHPKRVWQLTALASANLFTLPFGINAVLQPRMGIGCVPASDKSQWNASWVFGVDWAWNFARYVETARWPGRLALGYEFDHASLPARNVVALKIGFNGWHSYFPKCQTGKQPKQQHQQQQQWQQHLRHR